MDDKFTLTKTEIQILESKGFARQEVFEVESMIDRGESLPIARPEGRDSCGPSLDDVLREEPIGVFDVGGVIMVDPLEPIDELNNLDASFANGGVKDVLLAVPWFFVDCEHTYFTFLSAKEIRKAFDELELVPKPSKEEIELACGPLGLNLPCCSIDGTLHFDFEFVNRTDVEKARRAMDQLRAREEVLRFIVFGFRRDEFSDSEEF